MARRTKDEAERTRDKILDAAERVFYKYGVARTSLQQIAIAANVTRGAVYWHFRDKIELYAAMMDRVFLPHEDMLDKLAARETTTPLQDLCEACCHSLKMIATDSRRRRVVSILMHRCEYISDMSAIMKRRRECKDRMLERSTILFERARQQGVLAPHWKPSMAAMALHALITGLITGALEGHKNFDLSKSAPECIRVFFASVRSNS